MGVRKVTNTEVTYLSQDQVQRWAFCGQSLAMMLGNMYTSMLGCDDSTLKEELPDYSTTRYSLSSLLLYTRIVSLKE